MKLARALPILFSVTLVSCGGDSGPVTATTGVVPSPSPTPAPSQTPLPPTSTPTPTPSPPATVGDGKIVVVSEGSSSAIAWSGSHTGMFAASRSDIEFHGLAVGGSGVDSMTARRAAVLAVRPDVVSIYIGSNDLGADVDGFIAKLKSYVDPIRAEGTRVVICTLLPKQVANVTYSNEFNAVRKVFNDKIKRVTWVDGIADFGNHPIMGEDSAPFNTIYFALDGQHMTEEGQRQIYALYKPAMDKLVADVR